MPRESDCDPGTLRSLKGRMITARQHAAIYVARALADMLQAKPVLDQWIGTYIEDTTQDDREMVRAAIASLGTMLNHLTKE